MEIFLSLHFSSSSYQKNITSRVTVVCKILMWHLPKDCHNTFTLGNNSKGRTICDNIVSRCFNCGRYIMWILSSMSKIKLGFKQINEIYVNLQGTHVVRLNIINSSFILNIIITF